MAEKEAAGKAIRQEGTERAAAGPRSKPRRKPSSAFSSSSSDESGGGGGGGDGDKSRGVIGVMDEFFKAKADDSKEKNALEQRKMSLREKEFEDEREAKKAKREAEIEATKANTQVMQALLAFVQQQKKD